MIKKSYTLFLILIVMVACGESISKDQKQYENLRKEVLQEHDEVMKDLMTINLKLEEVESKIDSTSSAPSYKNSAEALKQAHKAMFDWMHDFDSVFPDINDQEQAYSDKEYQTRIDDLKNQQEELRKVKKQIKKSLSKAATVLKNDE